MRGKVLGTLVVLVLCVRSVTGWGQTDDLEEAARLGQQVGQLYRQGKYAEAVPVAKRALAIREKVLGPEHPDTATSLNNLALLYKSLGEYAQALPLYQRALRIKEKALGPEHPDTATSLSNLAELYGSLEEYAQALPLSQRALAIREKALGPEHPNTAIFLNNLALLYKSLGEYTQALQFSERGLSAEDRTFTNVFTVASETQKLQFVRQSQGNYLAALSLIHRHFSTDAAAVRFGLELVLRRKGMVLDAQSRAQETLTANLKGEALESWQRLTQHRSAYARLVLGGPGKRNLAEYRQALAELQAAISREEGFLAQQGGATGLVLTQRKVTMQRLAERLPKESALVEFVRIEDWDEKEGKWSDTFRYLAFVLTLDNRVTLVDLEEATRLNAQINETLAAVDVDSRELRKDLKAYAHRADAKLTELYDLLIRPLEAALGSCKRLIVSPDGELSKVPFAALRTPDGGYLPEKMTVSYIASGRDLVQPKSTENPTVDLLLVANPAFDDREALRAGTTTAVRAADYRMRFPPLPGTAKEARIIPPLIKGTRTVLEGTSATESAIHSIKAPKILHLATHGFFLKDEDIAPPPTMLSSLAFGVDEERGKGGVRSFAPQGQTNPMVRSGLALAGANYAREITTGDDGLLTALEVTGLNLYGTDLVVLSACETGLGDVQVGEGVYGLRRAFVLAGARNLVMSLWPVSDEHTVKQMEQFYRGYVAGKSPAQALREAQLQSITELRKQTETQLGEPLAPVKLWAPFIIQQTSE